jgi:hypothetical protein
MRDQAKSARVTGTAGALVLVVAFVMMILAAPAHHQSRPGGPAGPATLPAQTVAKVIQKPTASRDIRP